LSFSPLCQKETGPSFKKKKSLLEPCSTFSPGVAIEKQKKVVLEPLSSCPALPFSLPGKEQLDSQKKNGKLDPLFAKAVSSPHMSKKAPGLCLSSPSQEKAAPTPQKKKGKLDPLSFKALPSPHVLQKVPSLPLLDSISMISTASYPKSRPISAPDPITQRQKALGPQSRRGGDVKSDPFDMLDAHAKACFQDLLMTEEKMCGEWAMFYHSYSTSALIYEVQAAIAAVLFGFRSQNGALPRILVSKELPNALALQRLLTDKAAKKGMQQCDEENHDGSEEYTALGLSAMLSLLATGPEASPTTDFSKGYASSWEGASWDPDLSAALNKLLRTCSVPSSKIEKVIQDIIKLSEKHGLDVSSFNGQPCKSKQPGHLLQMCIRRDVVEKLAYASLPFGYPDESRQPMSRYMDGNSSFAYGQARVLARPEYFLEPDAVRLHTVSADPKFHANRETYQKELTELLSLILGDASSREDAARGIYGGVLPDGWTSDVKSRLRQPVPGARHLVKVHAKRSPGEL
jgi:hypothetical protein